MSDAQDQIERALEDSDATAEAGEEEPLAADPKPDRTRQFTHTSFSRVRTGWRGDDDRKVQELQGLADMMIREKFRMAFAVRAKIQKLVRHQAVDQATGEYMAYPDGDPIWVNDELGLPVEDWELLSENMRKSLMHTLMTNMFEWEIEAAKIWADAMYSKGIWEEVFARGFLALPANQAGGRPTVDDKTQFAHKNAAEDRYFALFRSSLSRQAEGILRNMRGLYRLLENTGDR
jgi:hypothetical protein